MGVSTHLVLNARSILERGSLFQFLRWPMTPEAELRIKFEPPHCRTVLGLSNISFGLYAYVRHDPQIC